MKLLIILLVVLLGLALYRLRLYVVRIRKLNDAIRTRRHFLREGIESTSDKDWEALCDTVNGLVEDNVKLRDQQSGQLAQLDATLGSLQEAVIILDANNYVLLTNRALEAMFPKCKGILKQRVELALHSRDFLTYITDVRDGRAEAQRQLEFMEGQQSLWVEATGATIPSVDGKQEKWSLFVLHNITKQRQLETVRKDFVANVSHELRTPLSIIKGYAETLVDGHSDMPFADRDQFLRTIQKHAERLHCLLEDLLILSRLESKNPGLHRELVDMPKLVNGIVDEHRTRPQAVAHEFVVTIDPILPEIMADPLKLTQVFDNLLGNALKYTPPRSIIRVALQKQNGELVISVEDNGPGIPPADLPHIFERFYRVDKGRSRETGGTGLGLSIVKHITQLHGGRIWVESELGKGTRFFMAFPLKSA